MIQATLLSERHDDGEDVTWWLISLNQPILYTVHRGTGANRDTWSVLISETSSSPPRTTVWPANTDGRIIGVPLATHSRHIPGLGRGMRLALTTIGVTLVCACGAAVGRLITADGSQTRAVCADCCREALLGHAWQRMVLRRLG